MFIYVQGTVQGTDESASYDKVAHFSERILANACGATIFCVVGAITARHNADHAAVPPFMALLRLQRPQGGIFHAADS